MAQYAQSDDTLLLWNAYEQYGLFPISSAYSFAEAVKLIASGEEKEVIVYNEYMGATPTVLVVQCIG